MSLPDFNVPLTKIKQPLSELPDYIDERSSEISDAALDSVLSDPLSMTTIIDPTSMNVLRG